MSSTIAPLQDLVAATFTPLHEDRSLHLEAIPPMVDRLADQEIAALYVLGSTGEGASLTFDERCAVAESFVSAASGRLPVIVQVGSESLMQARHLAAHASRVGADAISAVSPVYFKPDSVETLVASMAEIAGGAPELPFYYYHIPAVTGVGVSAVEFLKLAEQRIENLRGVKFTSQNVFEFQTCVEYAQERLQIFWGLDEMLQYGLAAGAVAAVGSTYNFATAVYQRLLTAFAAGDMETVRQEQLSLQRSVLSLRQRGDW